MCCVTVILRTAQGEISLHDVQFALCEFDKYERARCGQGFVRLYWEVQKWALISFFMGMSHRMTATYNYPSQSRDRFHVAAMASCWALQVKCFKVNKWKVAKGPFLGWKKMRDCASGLCVYWNWPSWGKVPFLYVFIQQLSPLHICLPVCWSTNLNRGLWSCHKSWRPVKWWKHDIRNLEKSGKHWISDDQLLVDCWITTKILKHKPICKFQIPWFFQNPQRYSMKCYLKTATVCGVDTFTGC